VKNALLAGSIVFVLSNVANAQGSEIYTRCGPSGSHFTLAADTQTFNYEASISGCSVAFVATLEVFHNGILKSTTANTVLLPPPCYQFNAPVNMSSWRLAPGDQVTFRLTVVRLGSTNVLASHTLTGDVVPPGPTLP
jgi:hypothetical protein